jgi:hypothetical protein
MDETLISYYNFFPFNEIYIDSITQIISKKNDHKKLPQLPPT